MVAWNPNYFTFRFGDWTPQWSSDKVSQDAFFGNGFFGWKQLPYLSDAGAHQHYFGKGFKIPTNEPSKVPRFKAGGCLSGWELGSFLKPKPKVYGLRKWSCLKRFIWVFPKIGVPQIIYFNRVFHYRPFWDTPILGNTHIDPKHPRPPPEEFGMTGPQQTYPKKHLLTQEVTLQGINISHLGKRKIIFKMPFLGWYVSSRDV